MCVGRTPFVEERDGSLVVAPTQLLLWEEQHAAVSVEVKNLTESERANALLRLLLWSELVG